MSESRIQFGLVATLKSTRVVLPLKAVKCAFSVEGGVAEVTVTQVYLQENRESLDCLYSTMPVVMAGWQRKPGWRHWTSGLWRSGSSARNRMN